MTKLNIKSTASYGMGLHTKAIALIYEKLLEHNNQNFYSHIGIVQVESIWQEVLFTQRKEIYINLYYPYYNDFEEKSATDKNLMILDFVHQCLVKIAAFENRLNKEKLLLIKQNILDKKFLYELLVKHNLRKTSKGIIEAEITVVPEIYFFNLFFTVKRNNKKIWRVNFFQSNTSIWLKEFFSKGTWISGTEIIYRNKNGEIEFQFAVAKKEIMVFEKQKDSINQYNLYVYDRQKQIHLLARYGCFDSKRRQFY